MLAQLALDISSLRHEQDVPSDARIGLCCILPCPCDVGLLGYHFSVAPYPSPYLLGCQRHIEVAHPQGSKRIERALTTAAGVPIAPDSPQPLAPRGLCVQGWVSSNSPTGSGNQRREEA